MKTELSEGGKAVIGLLREFEKIEEKNRCLRVKFLDWLSYQLADWSVRIKEVSDRIDSPCVIKIGEKK